MNTCGLCPHGVFLVLNKCIAKIFCNAAHQRQQYFATTIYMLFAPTCLQSLPRGADDGIKLLLAVAIEETKKKKKEVDVNATYC